MARQCGCDENWIFGEWQNQYKYLKTNCAPAREVLMIFLMMSWWYS
jgi:hypothetical protein